MPSVCVYYVGLCSVCTSVLSRDGVTIDAFWINVQIYWTL
jgi:hypothetical protein